MKYRGGSGRRRILWQIPSLGDAESVCMIEFTIQGVQRCTIGMGDHTIRTSTTDAYDAVAIAGSPSKPMGHKRHNAAAGYPTHESGGHEDEENET